MNLEVLMTIKELLEEKSAELGILYKETCNKQYAAEGIEDAASVEKYKAAADLVLKEKTKVNYALQQFDAVEWR